MVWRNSDPCGNESEKCKYDIVQYTRGRGIDVGCGATKVFPHFIGVDSGKDTELFGVEMKPDFVCEDATKLDFIDSASLDFCFSSHLLEHIETPIDALTEWWRTLKVGGYLVLYLPHRDHYPQIGQPGANPDHKHDFEPLDIQRLMARIGAWDMLVEEVRSEGFEYSFLQVFRKEPGDGTHVRSAYDKKPAKTACVVRYGGFGDSIQASNILPELKRQGFHVTFMTTPKGQDILKHDPHIDAWILQDDEQVPNAELPLYWAVQAKHFYKFIQLSESVEGTLLAFPGRTNHGWPDSVRRIELNKNYLEWTAKLAELPYKSEAKFYPSEDETAKANGYLADFKNTLAGPLTIPQRAPERFNILWCLAGSSMHKFYPHQDIVIARILDELPLATIILSGDYPCKLLEGGWENEPRIKCESGEMGIRDTLTLAQQVDLVIGPETGVLNAVAFESVPKVVMLSHSSPENLTKHWVNTDTLVPQDTDCWPCHRLHYGKEFCHEDPETGAALCQKSILPEVAFEAIAGHCRAWSALRNLRIAA